MLMTSVCLHGDIGKALPVPMRLRARRVTINSTSLIFLSWNWKATTYLAFRLCSYLRYVMPILQAHPKPKFTLEEARASGRLIEYESAGVTYAYTPDNRWINGHEWASPREIEEKTEDWQRPKPTRSWLVAQCLWWNLWRPGLKCPRDLTKVHLASALYDRIMGGGVSLYRHM